MKNIPMLYGLQSNAYWAVQGLASKLCNAEPFGDIRIRA